MWLDLFPGEIQPLPAPINIKPREPIQVELRVIIYDVYNIKAKETKPDVYLEVQIPGIDEK